MGWYPQETGNPSWNIAPIWPNVTSGSAKYADTVINALKTDSSRRQRFRATSNSLSSVAYFFAGECVFHHSSEDFNPACHAFSATYSASSTTYIQCRDFVGGNGAGLNAWYGCRAQGNLYTNVIFPPPQNHPVGVMT